MGFLREFENVWKMNNDRSFLFALLNDWESHFSNLEKFEQTSPHKKILKTPIIFDLTLIIPLICLEHLFWLNIEMVYDSWKLSRENPFVFYIHQLLQDYFCCNVYQ